jgi:hypothetical protein
MSVALREVRHVLSDADLVLLRDRGVALGAFRSALWDLQSEVFALTSFLPEGEPDRAEPLQDALSAVIEARDKAREDWEEQGGVFPFMIDRATGTHSVEHCVEKLVKDMADGIAPWGKSNNALHMIRACDVAVAHVDGIRNVIAVLLGRYI